MFRKNQKPNVFQFKYIIKCALLLTACNYARVKRITITVKTVNGVYDHFNNHFNCYEIKNHDEMEEFILNCASLVREELKDNLGYAIFAVNLIIKRLAPFIKKNKLYLLDAPLNNEELTILKSQYKRMSLISEKNYNSVMKNARKYIKRNCLNCKNVTLYQWELEEYLK